MAILNSIEGQAHVKLQNDSVKWGGYIIVAPDPANLKHFDIAGPASKGVYEGTVMFEGKYYFANGNIRVIKVNFAPTELRVEFVGIEKLNIINALEKNQMITSLRPDFVLNRHCSRRHVNTQNRMPWKAGFSLHFQAFF